MKLSGFLSTLAGAALLSLVVANILIPHFPDSPDLATSSCPHRFALEDPLHC